MKEIFLEDVVNNENYKKEKFKFNLIFIFSLISFVFGVLWGLYFLLFLFTIQLQFLIKLLIFVLPSCLFIASGVFLFKFRKNFCIEYDYTLVNDSVRIDKINKKVVRTPIIDFITLDIEKIGKFGSKTYEGYSELDSVNIIFCSPNEMPAVGKDFFYIVANTQGEKKMFVLETTETFISGILSNCKKGVLEADYK